jgi:hypothetical protein
MPISNLTGSTTKSNASQTNQSNDQNKRANLASSSSTTASKDSVKAWGDSYYTNHNKLKKLSFDREVIANLANATARKDSHFFSDSFFPRLWAVLPLVALMPETNIAVTATSHFVEPAVRKIVVAEAISSVQ